MASIILSFVGGQDPYSDVTSEEGSIVSLVKHLLSVTTEIKKILLLYTNEEVENKKNGKLRAEETRDWLIHEVKLDNEQAELIEVDQRLSQDPIDLQLAIKEAREAIEKVKPILDEEDRLDLNGSSGTPAMKAAWNILQAAGYADPRSLVWQVRDPRSMSEGQERVYRTDLKFLRREYELKVVKQQLEDYNYSSILITLDSSSLLTDKAKALLTYANARFARNFEDAKDQIKNIFTKEDDEYKYIKDINKLISEQPELIYQDFYHKTLIKLDRKEYAEFLIYLSTLNENILAFFAYRILLQEIDWKKKWHDVKDIFFNKIKNYDEGKLINHLKNKYIINTTVGKFEDFKKSKRIVMADIIEYHEKYSEVLKLLKNIEKINDQRNDIIHELKGIKGRFEIKNEQQLRDDLRQIIKYIQKSPFMNSASLNNPFDDLNESIIKHLNKD